MDGWKKQFRNLGHRFKLVSKMMVMKPFMVNTGFLKLVRRVLRLRAWGSEKGRACGIMREREREKKKNECSCRKQATVMTSSESGGGRVSESRDNEAHFGQASQRLVRPATCKSSRDSFATDLA